MRHLTAIKIDIGLKESGSQAGHHKYPDFGQLAIVRGSGMDWSKYVDVNGEGWHYDKVSGHREDDAESPVGHQNGMLLVPEEFAAQAAARYPEVVVRMTEAEAKTFYEKRCHLHEPEQLEDGMVIQTIAAKRQLGIAETQADRDALDPAHPAPGIRTNRRKKWTDFKKRCGLKFTEPPA